MEQGRDGVNGIAAEEFADRRGACAERARASGLDALVVTAPSDLRYLVGYPGVAALGPNPFCAGPAAAVVLRPSGEATLCAGEPDLSFAGAPVDAVGPLQVEAYETFASMEPLEPRVRLSGALARALGGARAVGFQPASLPVNVTALVADALPGADWIEAGELVMSERMRKSPAEVDLIRRAIAVCDAAQASVGRLAREGQSRRALYDEVRAVVDREAGREVPCILEVSFGPEADDMAEEVGGADLILTDVAPQVGAYWGDSCNTQTIDPSTDEQAAMLATVRETLDRATEAVRPGLEIAHLDTLMREGIGRRYPAYTGGGGHGIGLDFHESPRLVPSQAGALAAGMVIAMEPAVYLPDASVRLEHVVAVTADGCEVLSGHLGGGDRGA